MHGPKFILNLKEVYKWKMKSSWADQEGSYATAVKLNIYSPTINLIFSKLHCLCKYIHTGQQSRSLKEVTFPKSVINSKWPEVPTKEVLIHQENAPAHKSVIATAAVDFAAIATTAFKCVQDNFPDKAAPLL